MPAKKRLMVSLTEEQVKLLEQQCAETGLTKSSVLALALMDWVEERKKKAVSAGETA